jgi:amidase
MTSFTRRQALGSTAALTALASCGTSPAAQDAAPARAGTSPSGFQDGVALAGRIRSGDTSAVEAVSQAIERARAVNPRINAIADRDFPAALETAATEMSGPFAGVPTFIKDLEETRGFQTQYGSRGFAGYRPESDGPFARRWREAGMVFLGKSTTPEMGLTASTEPLNTGATRNPWNLDHIPGGSSGGAAALVAARVVPFAHASDGGGSIRIPATCCGLFGLKPSAGRIGRAENANGGVDISVNHAVTLTVRDSAALFAIAENGTYETLGMVEAPLRRRLKIGFAPEPLNGAGLDADVRAKAQAAASLCEELGHEVREISLPFDGATFTDAFTLYWAAGAAQFAQSAARFAGKPIGPDIVEPLTLGLAGLYQSRQQDMSDAVAYLRSFEARYDAVFEDIDVLLTPTVNKSVPKIGAFDPAGSFEESFGAVMDYVGFTPPMNVAGAASMSVPLYQGGDGLPIGVMFSGKRGDDGLLFELAYELEEALPWISRTPAVRA